MQKNSVRYLQLRPDDALPELRGLHQFKAILIIEADVPQLWQWDVSRWLVSSGCRYMLAWGKECGTWNDAVDEANHERFNYDDIPEDQVVMTTSHEDDDLDEVFWFAKHRARHPALDLNETVLIHVSESERQGELEESYAGA